MLAEALNLAWHGVVARLRQSFPTKARDLAATWALAGLAVFGLFSLWFVELQPTGAGDAGVDSSFGPFRTPGALTDIAMAVPFALALLNRPRLVRVTLLMVAALTVAVVVVHPQHTWEGPSRLTLAFELGTLGVSALGRAASRAQLISSAAAFTTLLGAICVFFGAPLAGALYWFWQEPAQPTNLSGLLIAVALASTVCRMAARRDEGIALLILVSPLALLWAIQMRLDLPSLGSTFAAEQVAATFAVSLICAVALRVWSLRGSRKASHAARTRR